MTQKYYWQLLKAKPELTIDLAKDRIKEWTTKGYLRGNKYQKKLKADYR